MPIGSTNVYNPGDLILSTVSGSGTSFTETKIIATTSSLILFNSNGTLTSASLNSTTVGTASYVSGSTSIITNIIASNISASGIIRTTQLTASSILASNGPLMITGSNAYLQMFPVGGDPLPTNLTASYIYTSGSTNDMYFTQYNGPYTNTTRLRWLESNLYTGILHGGVLTSTPGSTTFTVTQGEGLIVSMNAFTSSAPYPTVKMVSWPTSTQPITYSGSAKITYVGINNIGGIVQQTNAWGSSDINQWDNQIELGVVLHLSGSVSSGVFNSQQISYGIPQQTDDFLRAFGPLKISGHTLQPSGSSPTLSIKKTGGSAYREGANYVSNPNHPSTVVENDANTSKIYRYYLSGSTPVIDTGVANAGYTTIDNDKYVDTTTGELATVGNSNWTIQRVFWIPNSPTNAFIVYYGNATYSTLLNAVNAKDSEPFAESPNTVLNAIFVGYIIIEGGAGRDLLNAAECTIIPGGLFRNVGGVGSSGTAPVSTTLAGLSDVALSGLAAGDLLVYGGGQWNNNKTLNGNYIVSGSLTVQSGITGNLTGTSSWASNARTASYLTPSNSYTITNLTASTISASGAIIAGSFTGSFSGSIGTAVNATSASYALTSSYISPSGNAFVQGGNSFGTTALLGTNDAQPLALETNGTTRMSINSNGNVGIGTSTSILGKLQLDSDVAPYYGPATSSATPNGIFTLGSVLGDVVNTFGVDASVTAYAWIQPRKITVASYSNLVLNPNGGNVGIGTTLPASKFHISGSGQTIMRLDSDTITNVSQFQIKAASDAVLIMGMHGGSAASTNFGVTAAGQAYFGTTTLGSPHPTSLVIGNASNIPIIFSTNNVERMRIDSVGNVGIGTTTATNKLEVIGGTNTRINLGNIDDVNRGGKLEIISGSATARQFYVGTNSAIYNLVFGIDSIEKMRIDTAGNVGIGTTNPTARLHVSGSTGGVFEVDTLGGTTTLYVSASGNVGIGTTSTSDKLSVISGSTRIASSALAGILYLGNDGNNIYLQRDNSYDLSLVQNGDSNSALYLASAGSVYVNIDSNNNDTDKAFIVQNNALKAGTELFRIQENGNIGIGTTVPLAITDIQGTNVTLYAANYVGSVGTMYLRGNDAYNSGTAGAGIYLRGKYDSSSNVTTFGAISAIKENDIDGNYAGALTFLSRTNGQGSGAAEKMRIDSNGNVGIGTSSPIAKLDVSGSSRFGVTSTNTHLFTGSVSVSNNVTCLSLTETSTEAVKYNIIPLPSQLENVLKLTPVSFNYKTNDKHSIGLIAEEVAKIYPEFTSDNNDSISYGKITSVLIQSIKELKTIIDNQQKQIEDLVNKLK